MTVYYNPKSPIFGCLTNYKLYRYTCFYWVLKSFEFWLFVAFHALLAVYTTTSNVDHDVLQELGGEVPPSAAVMVQFFMTFFLTFYNKHCYERYLSLYTECMNIIDGALLFVQELTISLNSPGLVYHRSLATKYVLAAVYAFFMQLTGGKLSPKEWKELTRKGLLTKAETEALAVYPGGEVTLVLTVWCMVVIDVALEDDSLWQPHSQRIAHIHNRLHDSMTLMCSACNAVTHIIAMPIPFPYYHLMNVVLVLNFILAALLLALFRTYLTIIPYGAVVAVFLGLRSVATQLADPFGDDDVDFPVAFFINYTVDQAIALLESFEGMDRSNLDQAIKTERHFTDAQLTRRVDRARLYKEAGYKFIDDNHNWLHAAPISATRVIDENPNPLDMLHSVFNSRDGGINRTSEQVLSNDDIVEELEALYAAEVKHRRKLEQLNFEVDRYKTDGIKLPRQAMPAHDQFEPPAVCDTVEIAIRVDNDVSDQPALIQASPTSQVASSRDCGAGVGSLSGSDEDVDQATPTEHVEEQWTGFAGARQVIRRRLQAAGVYVPGEVDVSDDVAAPEATNQLSLMAPTSLEIVPVEDSDLEATHSQHSTVGSTSAGQILIDDPRPEKTERCRVLAFHFPGFDEPCDKLFQVQFLSNYFEVATRICIQAPCAPKQLNFSNAEAAFQATKYWKHAERFQRLTGEQVSLEKKKPGMRADPTFAGYGSNWNAMKAVLEAKFAGADMANRLMMTGDDFLLGHASVQGRDTTWTDNCDGSGQNLLGMQLMLVRDVLLERDGDLSSWTHFLIDASTGQPHNDVSATKWGGSVHQASKALSLMLHAIAAPNPVAQPTRRLSVALRRAEAPTDLDDHFERDVPYTPAHRYVPPAGGTLGGVFANSILSEKLTSAKTGTKQPPATSHDHFQNARTIIKMQLDSALGVPEQTMPSAPARRITETEI